MDHFTFQNKSLYVENVPLKVIAQRYGSPCYVYSRATLERHWHAFDNALADREHLICYAVKANSNIAILNLFARLGSGFDIVSVGELERVLAAGGDPGKVVFSGVAKRTDEMQRALDAGIYCFNVESAAELERLDSVAQSMGKRARVSIRVNPDVDAETHPYISTGLKENKFGIDIDLAEAIYLEAAQMAGVEVIGVDCHIGSQLTSVAPFVAALERVMVLLDRLHGQGIKLTHINVGGGLGIQYRDETPPLPRAYSEALSAALGERECKLIIEPGRAIAGNAGVLLTTVEYLKQGSDRDFAIVDAGMNDLIRPSLYGAWQEIVAVEQRDIAAKTYDVVGPVCETGDFLGKNRSLSIDQGDLLAVRSSGAYGFTMSSNYNSRPRVAEVLVDGEAVHLIRERESLSSLYQNESLIP